MYYYKKFLLILFPIWLVAACSDDTITSSEPDNDEDESSLSFPIDKIDSGEIPYLFFFTYEYQGFVHAEIAINLDNLYENVSLELSGKEIELFGEDNFYYGFSTIDEKTFTYSLILDDKLIEGSLLRLDFIEADFPSNFDFNSDYSFSWETGDESPLHASKLSIQSADSSIVNLNNYEIIPGFARGTIIKKELFDHFNENNTDEITVSITVIDADTSNDILVFSMTSDSIRYNDSSW